MLISLALAAGVFGACQEYTIDSQPEAPLALAVDAQDSYTLLATAPSKVVFNVSANTPWTIESDKQWCVPSPAMSAASSLVSEIVVTTEDNTDRQSRTATLTIRAEGIEESKVITITQASKESLVVVPIDERVDSYGETVSFTITSNKPWEVIPSTAFVSDIDKTSGEGSESGESETISITVPANPGAVRSGEITVKTAYETYTFTITQNGVVLELEDTPESNVISVGGSGFATEYTTKIRSNKEWKVKVPDEYKSWLSAEKDGDNLKVTVTQNNLLSVRKAQLILSTVELIDGFDGVTFEVEQPAPFTLSGSYTVDESTGYVKMMLSQQIMVVSKFSVSKGTLTIEYDEVKMSSYCNYGMLLDGSSNYKLILEATGWTVYSGGGGGWWSAKESYPYNSYIQATEMRKVQFVIEDDPDNAGKLRLRIYLNDELLDLNRTGKDNIFASGAGLPLKISAGGAPTSGDYCVFKSITYVPAE